MVTRRAPALISLLSHLNISLHCCPAGGRQRSRVKPLMSGNQFQKRLFWGGKITKQMYMRRTRIYWSLPGPAGPFSHWYAISAVNRVSILCFVEKKGGQCCHMLLQTQTCFAVSVSFAHSCAHSSREESTSCRLLALMMWCIKSIICKA